jgi:hypothetical protein
VNVLVPRKSAMRMVSMIKVGGTCTYYSFGAEKLLPDFASSKNWA